MRTSIVPYKSVPIDLFPPIPYNFIETANSKHTRLIFHRLNHVTLVSKLSNTNISSKLRIFPTEASRNQPTPSLHQLLTLIFFSPVLTTRNGTQEQKHKQKQIVTPAFLINHRQKHELIKEDSNKMTSTIHKITIKMIIKFTI